MGKMIKSLEMRNYGAVSKVKIENFQNLNLIIGENGVGKTFVLKAMYSAVRAMEEFKRGDDNRPFNDILLERLRWTYQFDKLGEIVKKGSKSLEFRMCVNDREISYSFGSRTVSGFETSLDDKKSAGNSVFIPAKEVLSLLNVILKSRDIDKSFGYDDTYYDLAKAINITSTYKSEKGNNVSEEINDLMGGKVEFDSGSQKWVYNKKGQRLSINITSEGIKKLAIISRLLDCGYITEDSVIFIDEIESSLHPKAISQLLDIIATLAYDYGLQIFISSHSYFVIKKMYLIALRRKLSLPCVSLIKNGAEYYDMCDGMPNNSIIDESIRLYEEEINEVLGK